MATTNKAIINAYKAANNLPPETIYEWLGMSNDDDDEEKEN